jgi:hypothetical protein
MNSGARPFQGFSMMNILWSGLFVPVRPLPAGTHRLGEERASAADRLTFSLKKVRRPLTLKGGIADDGDGLGMGREGKGSALTG